jgi:hypothetical protein
MGALGFAALGFVAGGLLRGREEGRVETRETTRVIPGGVVGVGPSVEEIRAVVREEVARSEVRVPGALPVTEVSPSDTVAEEAVVVAEQRLADAAARGSWTDEDRLAFRAQLGAAPPSERGRLMAELARKLNSGTRLATSGPPL